MPRKGENFTSVTVSNDTYEELFRKKTNKDESMESVIKRLVHKDVSGYKSDIDIQSKKNLLGDVKKSFDHYNKIINELNNFNDSVEKLNKKIVEAIK